MAAAVDPVISVCIVTGRRIPMLDACLASLVAQEGAPAFEVLVCSDGDAEVHDAVLARFPDATVCMVAKALPGAARNLLVAEARGELLFFLDDDVTFGPGLLAHLAELASAHPDVAVFGGPNDTPAASSRFQVVQGAVLASMVGSGPVRRRYGVHPAGPADERSFILCNLAVRREAMVPFALDLVCAEENGVLAEMHSAGLPMHYSPELIVYHERRATLRGFAQQMHKYGRGRGQLVARAPGQVRPAFLAPTGLLAYLLAAPVLAWLWGPATLVPALLYALAVAASALRIGSTLRQPSAVAGAALYTLVLHACYGTGVVRGATSSRRAVAPPEPLSWTGRRAVGASPDEVAAPVEGEPAVA